MAKSNCVVCVQVPLWPQQDDRMMHFVSAGSPNKIKINPTVNKTQIIMSILQILYYAYI